jgi:UPF0755 protein
MKQLYMKEKSKKNFFSLIKRRKWALAGAAVVLLAALGAWLVKRYAVDSFSEDSFYIYIRPTTTFEQLLDELRPRIDRSTYLHFRRMARLDGYGAKMVPGAYRIDPSMSAVEVYRRLVNGSQSPVRFTFNNIRTTDQLAARVASQLMMDSASLMTQLADTTLLCELGFTRETVPAMFLPDTYELYWTITPEEFVRRMKKEYDRFWDDSRRDRAASMGLTPIDVATIASIAEEETNAKEERGVVARLYLNRLQKGMPLQADPTVKFAIGDFSIKRITGEHLKFESPYNTYRNTGLPPGPIRIPAKATMQALLDSEPHEYIYMCAKEDLSGRHNFAVSYSVHQQNAARYRRALDQLGIK